MAVKKHGLGPNKNVPNNLGMLPYYLDSSITYTLSPTELIKWCKTIVLLLSKINMPNEPTEQVVFYVQVQHVEDYLKKMVIDIEPNSKGNLLFGLLRQFFSITSKATPQTCPAVSIVLSLLNSSIRTVAISHFVRQGTAPPSEDGNSNAALVAENESSLVKSLITLCRWLCYWEGTPTLEQWIIEIMKALEETKKYYILLDVSTAVICDIFYALQNPCVRTVVINVFLHILASTRDSIETFDKIADHIPNVLENLASETSAESRSVLQNLVEAFTALLDIHPAHKEQYFEIVNCLDSHIKSNTGMIMDFPIWKKDAVASTSLKKVSKCGLINLGNTCYMNSALQALFMTKQFSNGIVMSNLKFPLLCKLKTLFAHMMFSDIQFLNPRDIFNFSKPVNFPRGTQQDTSEFINHLLDRLHVYESYTLSFKNYSGDALKMDKANFQLLNSDMDDSLDSIEGISIENIQGLGCSSSSEPTLSDLAMIDDAGRRKRACESTEKLTEKRRCMRMDDIPGGSSSVPQTIVQKVFAGCMNTSTCCLNCNYVSSKKDAFWDLQLAFPERQDHNNYSIANLLDYFCSPEKLDQDNQYHCQNCDSLQDAERSVTIESAPKNLIVVLKQFFYDPKRRVRDKLLHQVKLNKYISLLEGHNVKRYELYAVIVHTGMNLDNGHYYTIARDSPQNWYIFNDADVQPCSEQSVYSLGGVSTPYIIFYKRMDLNVSEELQKPSESEIDKMNAADKADASSSDECSTENDFNPTEETIPFSFLPTYLVQQVKTTNISNNINKRVQRRKRHSQYSGNSDDDQPGSSHF